MDSHNYLFEDEEYKIYYPIVNNSNVVKALLKNKIWEKKIQDLFKIHINGNHTVIEVGPYIGSHTILLSKLAKKVIAIEPCKLSYECLKTTIENNNNLNNVVLHQVAAFSEDCLLEFGSDGSGGSSISKYRRKKFKENYIVPAAPLDDFLYDEHIDFIKIDAEGSEFEVLRGCDCIIQLCRPKIILEVWKSDTRMELLNEFLNDYNYSAKFLGGENYLLLPN